jgi:hypothetical protein
MLGDGDFCMGATAIWSAAHHRIPLLVLINNNRSYFNDELHQENVARTRGREVKNRWIGLRMEDPSPDIAKLAEAQGALGIGPVRSAKDVPDAIARGVAAFDASLILFGLPGSEILAAGRAAGLRVAAEAFADRAYEPDGSLASRRKPGAVVHNPDTVVARAVRMVKDRNVVAIDGSIVPLEADTICVHGDTPGSDELAAKIHVGFEAANITVKAIGSA